MNSLTAQLDDAQLDKTSVTWTEQLHNEQGFLRQYGFPAREDMRIGTRFARAVLENNRTDLDAYSGPRLARITAKVALLRAANEVAAATAGASEATKALRTVFKAVTADVALARFYLARVTDTALLDVASYQDAQEFAATRPYLDARRAEVTGIYKIFTQFVQNQVTRDGSYTGQAARQWICERVEQHEAAFEESSKADAVGKKVPSRLLYKPSTLPDRIYLVAVLMHCSQRTLAKIFEWATLTPWPLALDRVHLVTVHFDELLTCAEFGDLSVGLQMASTVPSAQVLPRQLIALNSVQPVQDLSSTACEAVKRLLRYKSRHLLRQDASRDTTRALLGRMLLEREHSEGLPVRYQGGRMLLDLFGLVYNVDALAPAPTTHGHGHIRLERSHQGQSNNGAPTGAPPYASQLLDHYRVVLTCGGGGGDGGGDNSSDTNSATWLPIFCGARLGEWTELLDLLHWLVIRCVLTTLMHVPSAQTSTHPELVQIAIRLLSEGGCGVTSRAMADEGAAHEVTHEVTHQVTHQVTHEVTHQNTSHATHSYRIRIPGANDLAEMRYLGAVERDENDIGEWWDVPVPLDEGNRMLVLRARGASPATLVYGWQDRSAPQPVVQWRLVPGPLPPAGRLMVNLARLALGLPRIGKAMTQRGVPVRVNKDGERFQLTDAR